MKAGARESTTDSVPPGWSYNPSTWEERLWLVGVAVLGFVVSSYLALYQYGLLEDVWEPFLGRDSEKVFHSIL